MNVAIYRAALDDLIINHSVRISNTKTIYWFSRRVPGEDNPLTWMDMGEADESTTHSEEKSILEKAKDLLESISTGKRPDLLDCEYFAATLSGAGGRVMVRNWMEGSFETLVKNISKWFDDLSIVSKEGGRNVRSPKLYSILVSSIRDMKDFPPNLETRIWKAAINNEPIPREFASMILREIVRKFIEDGSIYPIRYGVLKSYLIRKGGYTMTNYLNEEHPEAAYHCGRLLAVLGNLQTRALGDLNAGVIQKYYTSASITPALVLSRLIRTGQFHIGKLEKGLANIYEIKIANIWSKICDKLPTVLSLEEQSLFALGYYHQIAADNEEKMQRFAEKKNQLNQSNKEKED
jgi:CRISPR-associated protein Csd1